MNAVLTTGKIVHMHVGRGRAGSSSIQHFLRDHPDQLIPHNAICPKLPRLTEDRHPQPGTAHALAAYLRAGSDQPEMPAYRDGLSKVADFLASIPQQHVILSSEFLLSLPAAALAALKEIFEQRDLRVIPYCYVREPFDTLLSYYSQKVKAHGATEDVNEYLLQSPVLKRTPGSMYLTSLNTWSTVFDRDLVVRIFQSDKLTGGDVRLDFLHAMGFDPSSFQMPNEVNRSGNSLEVEAMRQLNGLIDLDIWSPRKSRQLLELTLDAGLRASKIYEFVDPQIERDIRAFFVSEVDNIKAKYFPDLEGPLFSAPPVLPTTRPRQQDLDVSKLLSAIIKILGEKPTGEQRRSIAPDRAASDGRPVMATTRRLRRPSPVDTRTPGNAQVAAPPASPNLRQKNSTMNMFVCADEGYEDFAPLYIASSLWSNPGVTVEVGVENTERFMSRHAQAIAPIVKQFGERSFLIRNGEFMRPNGRRLLPNSVRFVTTPMIAADYIYIGDIDIIVLEPDILDSHLGHMARTGLPFSNSVRPGSKRLTGLHFTRYEALYPLPGHQDLIGLKMNDEMLLTHLVRRKIGEFPLEIERFRPLHGIHASPNRSPQLEYKDGKKIPGWGIKSYVSSWREFRSSNLFKEMEPHLSERIGETIAKIDGFVVDEKRPVSTKGQPVSTKGQPLSNKKRPLSNKKRPVPSSSLL